LDVTTKMLQRARRSALRTRATSACDGCKLARSKCTGYQPCVRCSQNSHECIFKKSISAKHGESDDVNYDRLYSQTLFDRPASNLFEPIAYSGQENITDHDFMILQPRFSFLSSENLAHGIDQTRFQQPSLESIRRWSFSPDIIVCKHSDLQFKSSGGNPTNNSGRDSVADRIIDAVQIMESAAYHNAMATTSTALHEASKYERMKPSPLDTAGSSEPLPKCVDRSDGYPSASAEQESDGGGGWLCPPRSWIEEKYERGSQIGWQ
jgi:hypothetical protein